MPRLALIAVVFATALLAGCDMIVGALGLESPEKAAAAREADDRAIGAACRHAGRAIEDCFTLNKKADKAAVFAGWRDMNDYMRENKIEAVAPQLATQVASARPKAAVSEDAKSGPVADAPAPKAAADGKARSGEGGQAHDS